MNELTNLGELLSQQTRYSSGGFVYLPMDEVWQLPTECAVLSQSDIDEVPGFALQHGLSYALETASVHDIVSNARAQIKEPTLGQLLEAFLFYYDHDAFITFAE